VKVITDSRVLSALSLMDPVLLLAQLFSEVSIPEAVYNEVVRRGAGILGSSV
jgi:predicted nucleic acid-binding protein